MSFLDSVDYKPSRKTETETREFNLLSNKYVDAHDTKIQHDMDEVKSMLEAKYARTRIFNPVNQVYNNPSTEAVKKIEDKAKIQAKMHHQITHLPPTTRFSVGRAYNITSQDVVKDADLYADLVAKAARREELLAVKFGQGEVIRVPFGYV